MKKKGIKKLENEMKILGVISDKTGISRENVNSLPQLTRKCNNTQNNNLFNQFHFSCRSSDYIDTNSNIKSRLFFCNKIFFKRFDNQIKSFFKPMF